MNAEDETMMAELPGELPGGDLMDGADNPLTDIGAERLLLGYLLTDKAAIDRVIPEIGEGDFFDVFHRRIYACFLKGHEEGWIVTAPAIIEALGGDPKAKIVGDFTAGQYMARLIVDADMTLNPADMAAHLQAISERRAVGEISNEEIMSGAPFTSRMGLKMWSDRNEAATEYDFIVEDLIPKNEGVLVMGESGTGKSFLTDHLALCGARGVPFFGRRILKPFGTIWFAYEAARGQTARMRAYAKFHNIEEEDLPFAVLTKPVALWPDPKAFEATVEEIKGIVRDRFNGIPLGLCVFDTYNAATPGASEIDSEVVSKIRRGFDFIRAETGASTLIVGHTNSNGKHRGNEQLTNNIDTVIVIKRKTMTIGREVWPKKDDDGREVRTMRVQKQREGQDGAETDFILRVIEDGTTNKFGKPRTSCVVDSPNIADTGNDREPAAKRGDGRHGARVSKQESSFIESLLVCLDEFGVEPPPALGLPKSVGRVVEYDRLKVLMSSKLLRDEDDTEDGRKRHRERSRNALKRAREAMMHIRVIGCHDPFIWWTGKPVDGIPATYSRKPDLFEDGAPPIGDIEDFY